MEKLLRKTENLTPVAPEALAAYLRHGEALLEQVNQTLLDRTDLPQLLGGNPQQIMFDNHRYHFDFMANVFEFQAYDMLVRMVPWVYRAYMSHGFSADYFLVELEAWVDALRGCLAEEAGSVVNIYEFLLQNHALFLELAKPYPESGAQSRDDDSDEAVFYRHLLDGDFQECFRLSRNLLERSGSLDRLYLEIIQPAMYRIGRDWETGRISVAKEHLASAIVMRLLASIYPLLNPPPTLKGKVVITAAPNEFHEIGAWMVANALELDGWKTVFLGANTPRTDLLNLVQSEQPKVLALSIAMPFNLRHVKKILHGVKNLPCDQRPRTLVGGQVFRLSDRLQQTLGADGYADNCAAARNLLQQWWDGA